MKIDHGKAVVPHRAHSPVFPTNTAPAPQPYIPNKETEKPSELSKQLSPGKDSDSAVQKTSPDSVNLRPSEASSSRQQASPAKAEKNKLFASLTGSAKSTHDISCFDCDRHHQVSTVSTSTLCPKCGLYISLKNYDIREAWNQRIQTRGNVIVHKKGVVSSATIRCHNLVIDGIFNGGADCSGDFTIRNSGKIMGRVSCKKLLVEKRAHVQFLNATDAEEVIIDGEVIGSIRCKGKLSLLKKATLTGDIHVGSLTVAEGARHHGQISMS